MDNTEQPNADSSSMDVTAPASAKYSAFGIEFDDDMLFEMMYQSSFNALTQCTIDHIKLPRYKRLKNDFTALRNMVGYKGFRLDVLDINHFPITRKQMDACWMKTLCRHFKDWNPTSNDVPSERVDILRENWKYRMPGDAISQVSSIANSLIRNLIKKQRFGTWRDNVQEFWEKQAEKYPGLDITVRLHFYQMLSIY